VSPRREKLDPRRTTVHGHRLDPRAVEFYERNPRGRYGGSGGHAVGRRLPNGRVVIENGANRRQAAINQGRRLEVEVYGPEERLPSTESGCVWVTLLGLGGVLAGVVEAVRLVIGA
jgi:hypothetical protein